jgi:hypothetical protein
MPTKPIYFGPDQRSGDQQLAGAPPLAINVVVDGAGAVRRRPGISSWSGFPGQAEIAPVIGMGAFEGALYFVTQTRRIYKIAADVGTSLSAGALTFLAGTERPVFAVTPFRMAIAGGGVPEKIELPGFADRLGGSPPPSRFIAALAQRLVSDDQTGSDSTGRVRFTYVGNAGNEDWDPLNFTSAEARPDAIVAVRENANELFAFGETSLQVFSPDPTVIFAPGRALNRGCAAGHSVIAIDEQFAWLTNRREFVMSDGRSVQVISDQISATLDSVPLVSDCYGFRWSADQFDVACWQMPTDGRTFAAQIGGGWAQWHGWTPGQGHTLFPITSHFYWEEQNLHLVGMADGTIAQLDSTTGTDLGATIKAEVVTGFLNRETDAWKSCDAVRLTFKRGQASGPTEPQVLLSWRDGQGAFSSPLRLGLGVAGDQMFTIERRSLGMYRARQWKLEFTDAVDFVLARVEETFSVGGTN